MPLTWCGCAATSAWPSAHSPLIEQWDMAQPWVVLEEEEEEEEEEGSSSGGTSVMRIGVKKCIK